MKFVIMQAKIGDAGIVTKGLKNNLGRHNRETVNRFTTKDSHYLEHHT